MINPMLCQVAEKPFSSPAYIAEDKKDGVRAIAILNGNTKLQGRDGADITSKFPELAYLHTYTDKPCILDGEITGKDFTAIQERIHKGKKFDIKIASKLYPCEFYAFDILYQDKNLTGLPLRERKELLKNYRGSVVPSVSDGVTLFTQASTEGKEGIVIKRLDSTYQVGARSPDWLKVKAYKEDIFYIIGLTKSDKQSRSSTFGSLVLANDKLEYVGNAGSGLSDSMLIRLRQALEVLKSDCPLSQEPDIDEDVLFWTKPLLKCEIRFLELGSKGKLRFPTFRRLV